MYRQLRHAYQMSRPEALVRVSFLLLFTVIVCLYSRYFPRSKAFWEKSWTMISIAAN